ncbi:hypothetical protein HXX76_013789 [Chlamydomonas incerta]|uniref:Uncharacterized protein n=1 Tax=Chlamydomonas incerta TaxID=51695 RepID=A0A835SRM6_CHLIN|nr:hypothetical protein HXX76_013789 [Chlamydomonas incerta]|eukprot:KAG2425375.1 hypothetical protein HXX76_013789 [Chlamydomonas incerta]
MQCGETSSAGTATLGRAASGTDPLGHRGSQAAASQMHARLGPGGAAMNVTSASGQGLHGSGYPQQFVNGPGAGGVPQPSAPTHSHIQAGAAAGAFNSGAPVLTTQPYLHRVSSGGTASAHVQTSTNGQGPSDAAAFARISDSVAGGGVGTSGGAAQQAFPGGAHGWVMGAQPPALVGSAAGGSRRGRKPKPRLPDLQSQLDALSQQFERLSSENVFLKSKLKALEKVVPSRQVSLDFLASVKSSGQQPPQQQQQQQQQQAASTAAAAAAGQAQAQPGVPSDGAVPSPSGSSSAGPAAAEAALGISGTQASASVTPASAAATAPAPAGQPGGAALASAASASALAAAAAGPSGAGWVGTAPSQLLILELCPGPDGEIPTMSPAAIEELRRTGVKEFLELWKHATLKTSVLVAAAEALGPGSAHAARLDRYVGRLMDYMDRITLLAPHCWFQSLYINAETLAEERPTDDFWMAIGKYANFSLDQLEEIENLAKAHDATVAPVVLERARLASELSTHISTTMTGPAVVESAHGISALSAVDTLTEQLQRNVLKEHQSHLDSTDFLCWSVLTPVQVSRIMAASYPYIPDGVAIMHACRALYRQAAEQQLQQKTAQAQFQQFQQQQQQQQSQ